MMRSVAALSAGRKEVEMSHVIVPRSDQTLINRSFLNSTDERPFVWLWESKRIGERNLALSTLSLTVRSFLLVTGFVFLQSHILVSHEAEK